LLVLDLNLWKPQNAPYQRPTSQVQAWLIRSVLNQNK
jgi:hypothetical protein